MKKILILLFIFLNTVVYGQYSALTVFPTDNSVLASFENIDDDNWGFQIGGFYKIGATSSPYIYKTPYMCFNRVGINYGLLHCGIVLAAGIKVDMISGPDAIIYPDFTVKFQPLKLLTRNKDMWDVSISYNISDKSYIGFGISIPYRYGSYYR
jgi:hypothetical protein